MWQELEALLEAANRIPLERLERDSKKVAVEVESFLKRLDELGMLTD
jgi:hypothetical protein